jgi:D-amino-acid dehydrogenase
LLRECLLVSPGLADATFGEVRVGLRPVAADGRPVLGRAPGWENVYVATGHGADGLLLGPYTASLMARMALGRPAPGEPTPFGPGRFAAGG